MYQAFNGKNILKACAVVVLSMVIAACSVSNAIIKTYDGDELPKEQQAMLTAPENLTLISVNGKEMPIYLLSNLSTQYGLVGGTNHLVVKYESVWAKHGVKAKGEARSEKTESEPVLLSFEAKPGETYNFAFEQVETLRDARSFAESFSTKLVDKNGSVVAESVNYEGALDADSDLSLVQRVFSNLNTEKGAADSKVGESSNLGSLKAIWSKASAKERKAFLAWAFKE